MAVDACALLLILIVCSSSLLSAKGEDFFIGRGAFKSSEMRLLGGSSINATGYLSLIPDGARQNAAGVAYYHEAIRMLDPETNATASFSIWFKSYQFPEIYRNSSADRRGDGMTVCLSSDGKWVGGNAALLGFFPEGNKADLSKRKLFAIEYDTFQNARFDDPPDDHIGIDVNSAESAVTTIGPLDVKLWQANPAYMVSWIDYNGTSKVLEVRVSNSNQKPGKAALTYTIDLFSVMDEEMYVGFSAGTGDAYSLYFIEEWEFGSSGLPPKKSSSSSSLGLIIGSVAGGVVVLLFAGVGLFFFIRRRRESQEFPQDNSFQHMVGMPDYYSYKQLSAATKGFSESSKLGEGGFGTVYKGILPSNGMAVAVKRVSAESKQGEKEFMAEVSIISQIRHRNIVQLMGWCRDRGKFLLVYELMPNGSLDKALFQPKSPDKVLSWQQRIKILSGLASAIDYLHQGWRQQVIHRDVKSSNIMLDNEFNAKLGDFGLARLVDHSKDATTTLVAGTYGYIAPETTGTGKFTDKTDVYAFGAVALEIATGRKAFGDAALDGLQLVDTVWKRLGDGNLISVADQKLEGQFDVRDLEVVLLLGLLCSHPDPKCRPLMRQVVQVLAGEAPVPPVPATKPAMTFSSYYAITLDDLEKQRSSERRILGPSSMSNTSATTFSLTSSTVDISTADISASSV